MREITWLDNKEPREAGGSKTLWKETSLAVKIEESEVHRLPKEDFKEDLLVKEATGRSERY